MKLLQRLRSDRKNVQRSTEDNLFSSAKEKVKEKESFRECMPNAIKSDRNEVRKPESKAKIFSANGDSKDRTRWRRPDPTAKTGPEHDTSVDQTNWNLS